MNNQQNDESICWTSFVETCPLYDAYDRNIPELIQSEGLAFEDEDKNEPISNLLTKYYK